MATAASADGLPGLERACLALMALADMGMPLRPEAVTLVLETWRVGGQFRWDTQRDTDWTATSRAVVTLASQSAPIPPEIRDAILRELSQTRASDGLIRGDFSLTLAFWEAADVVLPTDARAPYRQDLGRLLAEGVAYVQKARPSGPTLSMLESLHRIAGANEVGLQVPLPNTKELEAFDGLLKFAPGDVVSDPHTTFLATALGWRPTSSGLSTVASSGGPRGWLPPILEPDPEATFFGLILSRPFQDHGREAALVRQVKAWLDAAASDWATAGGVPRQVYFSIALAKELGIALPVSLVDAIELEARTLSVGNPKSLNYAAMAGILNLDIPGDAAPPAVRSTSFATVPEAYLAWLWGTALHLPEVRAAAGRSVAANRTPAGAVRGGAGQEVDLFSTAVDHRIAGLHPNSQAAAAFSNGDGYWHMPPGSSASNVVDLQGFYLAAYVLGDTVVAYGIF